MRNGRLTLLAIAVATACAFAVAPPLAANSAARQPKLPHWTVASPPRPSKRLSPTANIFSGSNWSLAGWKSNQGVCLSYGGPGETASGCGSYVAGAPPDLTRPTVPHRPQVSVFQVSRNGPEVSVRVIGMTSIRIVRVLARFRSGRLMLAQLVRAPARLQASMRFFDVTLPGAYPPTPAIVPSPLITLLPYDAHGRLLARRRF
jgi:hypothetical protein